MTATRERPRAWTAAEAEADTSWQRPLGAAAVADIEQALRHAEQRALPLLDMRADDFPLRGAGRDELGAAFEATQSRWGFCLLRGFPVERWTPGQLRLVTWGIGLHVGLARTQNAASDILNDVRDEGGSYQTKGGRGYNTNRELDFHIDFADVVALMCRRDARSGGRSLVTSSMAIVDALRRHHPEEARALEEPLAMSWQGAQAPGDAPTYMTPLHGMKDGYFAFRTNRKNIVAAQRDYPEAPRLSDRQARLVARIDTLCADPRLCLSMDLRPGDLQLLNNYVVVHSRTAFEDHAEPDMKRHLLRLWLNLPAAQPLPDGWLEAFKDTRAGAVRGGLRGSGITPQFVAYELRQARALGMARAPA